MRGKETCADKGEGGGRVEGRQKEHSFKRRLLTAVLCITIPLTALLIGNNLYSIQVFNGKLADSNQRTVDYCAGQIGRDLSSVDETLRGLVAGNTDFITLTGGASQLRAHLSSLELYNELKTVMPSYPSVGAFFIYSVPSAVERDMFTADFSYGQKQEIQQFVREAVIQNRVAGQTRWEWEEIGGEVYLFRFYGGRGTYIAAMTPVSKLLESARWQLDREAVAAFVAEDNSPLTQQAFLEEQKIALQGDYSGYFLSGSPRRYMVIGRGVDNTNCRLVFLVSGAGFLDSLTPVQWLMLGLSILAVLLLPLLFVWMRRSIIAPVDEMTRTMERIRSGDLEAQVSTRGQLSEFRQMNETFNTMMSQIRALKISGYEKEIETQKAELRYLQLQIRPHFFLNCLKSLYALAQQKEYEKIQHMILSFSKYIRYIFRDNLDFVPLGRELEHVRNYMEIQRISAVHPPACAIHVEPALLELPVPPLSVQTFVENSVKHETDPDFGLEIEIRAAVLNSGEGTYVDITVEDNGSGFPEAVLEEINNPESPVYAQHHVGLNNIKKRMTLIYGEEVLFAFFNSDRGSVSEILIPVDPGILAPGKAEEKRCWEKEGKA